jgi:ABC-type antimicrobial peptide transport system permease subunit
VLRDSLMLTALGVAIGIPFAVLTGRALASSLYGVKPDDAMTFALAVMGIALIAIGASMIPARRAASIDPLTALRSE